jgi:hypothetical protein
MSSAINVRAPIRSTPIRRRIESEIKMSFFIGFTWIVRFLRRTIQHILAV